MPALSQAYPREVAALDRHVRFASTRVMDVGANVGQSGFVLKTFFPHLEVVFVFAENAASTSWAGKPTRIQVRLEHLSDDVLSAHAIPRECDFVKSDVEGFERDVLASLQSSVSPACGAASRAHTASR